ncbi:transposase [Kocuria sp.]|uniref:transposase n=1 Tax=Kocuria sp. TaxID=1871328 RepID=UPI0026E00707|nr:transposase [Kocuria sp.]MDO5619158.1 transposase [Kocuria sp.]
MFGIGRDTAAQLLITAGDNPEQLRSEAAFAAITGSCRIPAWSGKTNRHRLNRAGDRQANSALYHVLIVHLRYDQETRDYAAQTTECKKKMEIIRRLKRYLVRQLYPSSFTYSILDRKRSQLDGEL